MPILLVWNIQDLKRCRIFHQEYSLVRNGKLKTFYICKRKNFAGHLVYIFYNNLKGKYGSIKSYMETHVPFLNLNYWQYVRSTFCHQTLRSVVNSMSIIMIFLMCFYILCAVSKILDNLFDVFMMLQKLKKVFSYKNFFIKYFFIKDFFLGKWVKLAITKKLNRKNSIFI